MISLFVVGPSSCSLTVCLLCHSIWILPGRIQLYSCSCFMCLLLGVKDGNNLRSFERSQLERMYSALAEPNPMYHFLRGASIPSPIQMVFVHFAGKVRPYMTLRLSCWIHKWYSISIMLLCGAPSISSETREYCQEICFKHPGQVGEFLHKFGLKLEKIVKGIVFSALIG